MSNINWDAKDYQNNFNFVTSYGEDVLSLITKEPNSFIVDLGCGNGGLTKKLNDLGFKVLGIDDSDDMLKLANEQYPSLSFKKGNAIKFKLDKKADVIFSNAVFHWINKENQLEMLKNIYNQLADGGQLVCEFGGYGCAESVHSTLEKCFNKKGLKYLRKFYFPTIGEYSPLLEQAGFKVEYAILFDRPTPQKTKDGLKDWINMFVKEPFKNIDDKTKNEIIDEAVNQLKDTLFIDNTWIVDYVRIRVRAVK